MKRFWLLAVAAFLLLSPSVLADTVWYFDRAAWTAAVSGNNVGNVSFEGIAPINGYISLTSPSILSGVTFEQINASNPYFYVVDSGFGAHYDWGTGALATIGKGDYSGFDSYMRIGVSTWALGFDVATISDANLPVSDTVVMQLANGESYSFSTLGGQGFLPTFIGFTTNEHVGFVDFHAQNYYTNFDNVSYVENPEPASLVLLSTSLGIIGLVVRYRARKR